MTFVDSPLFKNDTVDFCSSRALSAGRAMSLLNASACGASPVPLIQQESPSSTTI